MDDDPKLEGIKQGMELALLLEQAISMRGKPISFVDAIKDENAGVYIAWSYLAGYIPGSEGFWKEPGVDYETRGHVLFNEASLSEIGESYQPLSASERRATVGGMRKAAGSMAYRIQHRLPLSDAEAFVVANIVREWAQGIPDRPKRRRGQVRQFDHLDAAINLEKARRAGRADVTVQSLAEKHGVSTEAMQKAVKKHEQLACAFLDFLSRGQT